jgi:hypothetical protein
MIDRAFRFDAHPAVLIVQQNGERGKRGYGTGSL